MCFIVGVPRSGTTLLERILHNHSRLSILSETHYFNKFWRHHQSDRVFRKARRKQRYVGRFLAYLEGRRAIFSPQEVTELRHQLMEKTPLTHRELLLSIGNYFMRKKGAVNWGEKTPAHMHFVPQLLTYFPASKVLCILRDPRDMSLSWQSWQGNRGNAFYHGLRWRLAVMLAYRLRRRYPERFMLLRYEDLISQAETTVKRICEFLGLKFEPEMLLSNGRWYQDRRHHIPVSHSKVKEPIDSDNMDKWRGQLAPADVRILEMLAGRYLELQDYERSGTPMSLGIGLSILGKFVCNWHLLLMYKFRQYKARLLAGN